MFLLFLPFFCNPLILSHGGIKDNSPQIIVLLKAIDAVVYLHGDMLIYTALADLEGILLQVFYYMHTDVFG